MSPTIHPCKTFDNYNSIVPTNDGRDAGGIGFREEEEDVLSMQPSAQAGGAPAPFLERGGPGMVNAKDKSVAAGGIPWH